MGELIGAIMIVALFAGLFVFAVITIGRRGAAVIYLVVLMLMGWLYAAAWLIEHGLG